MSKKIKRTLCGIGAVVAALTLAIGGTFAYSLFERKSNIIQANVKHQARLVEDYDPNPTWEAGRLITKKVSVKNMGGEKDFRGENWNDIYVRVQIREYMDIVAGDYLYFNDNGDNIRFMVDKSGDFVKFIANGDIEDQLESIRSDSIWTKVITDPDKREAFINSLTEDDFEKINGFYDEDKSYFYLKTKDGDPNGQYGAFVVTGKNSGTPTVISGEARGDYDTYDVHKWGKEAHDICGLDTHQYIEWIVGNHVVMLDDWDNTPVKAWILDPVTGWATWGDALPPYDQNNPQNETKLLLEAIRPVKYPDGEIYYDIYVEMEAISLDEMDSTWVIDGIFDTDIEDVENDELNINDDSPDYSPEKGFETKNNDADDDLDFGVYVLVDYAGEANLIHGASISLNSILSGVTDYDNIEVVAIDDRFTDFMEIKNDPRNGNAPSLFFNWFPANRAEMDEIEAWNGPITFGEAGSFPIITTQVKLTQGTKETTVFKVTFYYTNSMFAY